MKSQLTNRRYLIQGTTALALLAALGAAIAQTAPWPNKPIKIIVGFPPGTTPDIFARLYGEALSKRVGVPVVVESKLGAGGNLASEATARAAADGYTVMYNLATTFTANPYLYTKLPYDPVKDFVPVATTMRQGLVLIASPAKVSAKTLKELLPALSAKPGAMSYGSYGAGTPSHLIMEWLLEETKTSVVHVPYKGSAVNDVIAGTVELAMEPISTAMPFITSGRIKALAYSGDTRHAALLDVPTLSESVPALNITSWHGIWAPAATPTAIVARLNSEFVSISRDPDMQQRIRALNVEPLGLSTAEMISLTKRDADNMSRVIKAKNITLD